jgi:transposase
MTPGKPALAPASICRDFEADVLARLVARRATLHGCPVVAVECRLDGGVVVWFAGLRDGARWRGAIRFTLPWLAERKVLADAAAVSEVALRLLATIPFDHELPLIQRASA